MATPLGTNAVVVTRVHCISQSKALFAAVQLERQARLSSISSLTIMHAVCHITIHVVTYLFITTCNFNVVPIDQYYQQSF